VIRESRIERRGDNYSPHAFPSAALNIGASAPLSTNYSARKFRWNAGKLASRIEVSTEGRGKALTQRVHPPTRSPDQAWKRDGRVFTPAMGSDVKKMEEKQKAHDLRKVIILV